MCASYGLGSGAKDQPLDFKPFSEIVSDAAVARWMREQGGQARITGRRAVNLNPLIRGGERGAELAFAWWWLWLDGSGPAPYSAFNSRDDKLLRSWRKPFQHRALLPATWYVEKTKRFGLPSDGPFLIAAITSTVVDDATGESRLSYSMVTRDAVGEAAGTHPRMPLVLPESLHDDWLDPERPGDAELVDMVRIGSDEISHAMTARPAPQPVAKPGEQPTLF